MWTLAWSLAPEFVLAKHQQTSSLSDATTPAFVPAGSSLNAGEAEFVLGNRSGEAEAASKW